MPLPKINTPTYELTLPSNNKKIKYRPFLVREEKILIMALESEDTSQITSAVVDILNKRKGMMQAMAPAEGSEGSTQVTFSVPTRGMIGVRSALLSATRGEAVMDTQFDDYRAHVGPIQQRDKGSLLAFEDGVANPNGISGAQSRGNLFITPKTDVYKDMIVGIHQRPGDLPVNVCKTKQLTNMRAAGSDDN